MDSATIRDRFFAFFEERDHRRVPSSSLVPNDPTLLLTNAGMNQFKPYLLGEQQPAHSRAMSVQKCFRTTDIDEVGDASHLTFFEMLGNFSFGDYYKEKACPWAWELMTEGWGFDSELLWVTIFETDEEARDVWVDLVGVRPERIVRRGKKDNFWSMGVAGPCGPSSELFVDLGERFGEPSEIGPAGNEERYVEMWNLVFMENDCNAQIEPIAGLPKKNIDTGAGVERLAFALQRADSIYGTDTLRGLVDSAAELTGKLYGKDDRTDAGLRILADHGRGVTFLIGDGVLPSNEERGYVLRRMMRRAVRHSRLLGREGSVLPALVDATVELMANVYPEIRERRQFIIEVAEREEERFGVALKQGMTLLEGDIREAKRTQVDRLSGDVAFRLHDTFGFPVELTKEIAREEGLSVDDAAFEVLMSRQRDRARAARRTGQEVTSGALYEPLLDEHGPTEFLGYEHLTTTATVIGIAQGSEGLAVAGEGDEVDVVLDRTVFYAEGGGQVGDRGTLRATSGRGLVTDARRLAPGLTGHRVRILAGEISVGEDVALSVDVSHRAGAERAHTATHLLHWVLRDRLGEHARQAGSLVEPGRLRFDFNHYDALGASQVADITDEIQERVMQDDPVRAYETSYEFARSIGAMAIFGEKYGDFVRVVEVGDYSKELCGGTHVAHSSQIGVAVITAEASIGANLRRVEALVGREGIEWLQRRSSILESAAGILKTNPDEVAVRVERLTAAHKDLERRIAEVEKRAAESEASRLVERAVDVDGSRLLVAERSDNVDALRSLAQLLKGRLGSSVIVLGAAGEGKANLVGAVTGDLTARGISARDLLAPGAALLGGGAGGRPDLAISGGPAAGRLQEAMQAVERAARDALAER
jgi:alanyl-tRNA synthetase